MHYANSLSAQAVARVAYILSGTIVFVVLARVLGPSLLGSYVYALNLITIASALIDLSSTGILARDLVAHGPARQVYLADYLALRGLLALFVGSVAVGVTLVFAPADLQIVLLLCCPLLPLISARFFDPIFQVGGRPWLSVWLTGGYGVYLLLSAVIIALTVEAPVPWLVAAHALGATAYGAVGLALTQRLLRPDFRGVTWVGMRRVAISIGPFGVSGLFNMLAIRLDVFLIAALGSIAMVGQFNAAFRFVDLGVAVMITVLTPLVTVFAQLAKADRAVLLTAFQAMLRFIATWSTAVAVLAPTLSPAVVLLLYGPDFAPTAPVLDLLAWKFQIAFVNLLVFALLMTVGSIRFTWWNSLQALVLNLALNYLLIPILGINGAGVASIVSEVSQTAVDIWFLTRCIGNVFVPRWWGRLAGAALAGAAVVHLPVDVAPLWLAAPAAAVFVAIMHLTGGLPGNPLRAVTEAETAARRRREAAAAAPAS